MSIEVILTFLLSNFFIAFILCLIFPEGATTAIDHMFHPKEITYLSLIILILFSPTIIWISIVVGVWYCSALWLDYVIDKLEGLLNRKVIK